MPVAKAIILGICPFTQQGCYIRVTTAGPGAGTRHDHRHDRVKELGFSNGKGKGRQDRERPVQVISLLPAMDIDANEWLSTAYTARA
jgi:hypothetical protein